MKSILMIVRHGICGNDYAGVDVVITAVVVGDCVAKVCEYVDRCVVVSGCVPMSVDAGVGIHRLND